MVKCKVQNRIFSNFLFVHMVLLYSVFFYLNACARLFHLSFGVMLCFDLRLKQKSQTKFLKYQKLLIRICKCWNKYFWNGRYSIKIAIYVNWLFFCVFLVFLLFLLHALSASLVSDEKLFSHFILIVLFLIHSPVGNNFSFGAHEYSLVYLSIEINSWK